MKTLIIVGCSWSAGEWGAQPDGNHGVIHPGLTEFLSCEGYNVINLSHPGSGMNHFLAVLRPFLQLNSHLNISRFFFVQTDLGRDFDGTVPFSNNNTPTKDYFLSSTGEFDILNGIKTLWLNYYKTLNMIAKNYNVNIDIIGGLTDVIVDFNEFDHLKCMLNSWPQLMDSSESSCVLEQHGIRWLNNNFPNQKKEILPYVENVLRRRDYWKSRPDLYYPDGGHPNRIGHKILSDYIINSID